VPCGAVCKHHRCAKHHTQPTRLRPELPLGGLNHPQSTSTPALTSNHEQQKPLGARQCAVRTWIWEETQQDTDRSSIAYCALVARCTPQRTRHTALGQHLASRIACRSHLAQVLELGGSSAGLCLGSGLASCAAATAPTAPSWQAEARGPSSELVIRHRNGRRHFKRSSAQ
jgi:hypothetical protein